MYFPNSTWTWAFSIVTFCQAIIAIALEAYVFGQFESSLDLSDAQRKDPSNAPARTIPTYLSVFIFGFLYQLLLVWDALRLKNTIQVIGLCLYNLGMLIYSAVQMDQIHDAVKALKEDKLIEQDAWTLEKPLLIAVPCVIALGTVLMSYIAWNLYKEFAWTIYKHISADLKLKRCYLVYQIYIALLKFDFFFFLGFTVQFLVIVGSTDDTYIGPAEFYLTIIAIPVTIALLFLAAYFTRRESHAGQVFIIAIYFAAMAYFIFKLERMYAGKTQAFYYSARRSLTTFAVLTILLLVITIIVAAWCEYNFGKGLKRHVQRRKVPDADEVRFTGGSAGGASVGGKYADGWHNGGHPGQHQLGPVSSRMTID
ncbi:hypothetical protein K431DRAFT_226379 [Polychaeton citri CBS 116435]|uniref:Uncharacterized protein n=1 Tax=Polychaeton citri CBS 116435 TaxID=1314669 RepID=A0A9P4UPI4_9PEZI|nr:hypothetical protein K431DRAFT_226379 [Polychaeton citri CBS 116435]